MFPDNPDSLTSLRHTDKCVDKAVERLESLQKVKHLRELIREGITVESNENERKVLLATDSSANPTLAFIFKDNSGFYYSP